MDRDRLDTLLRWAIAAGRQRDYPQAIALLKEILVHSDEHPQALLYLGRSYHAVKDYPRAIHIFRFYLRLCPGSAPGHFFLGRSYLAGGLLRPAIRHLLAAAEGAPGFAPAFSLLGFCLLKARKTETALQYFEQAMRLAPGQPGVVTGYLNALLTSGIRLFHRRRLPEAAAVLQRVVERRGDNLLAHLYLARIYRELDQPQLSLRHCEEAARLSPADPALHLQKAFLHLQARDEQGTYHELREAARILGTGPLPAGDPRIADPHSMLRFITLALFRNNRFPQCVYYGRKALKQQPDDGDMHLIVAEAYRQMGSLARARHHYRLARERGGGPRELRYGLLDVLWRQGDYRELAEELKQVFLDGPDDPVGVYYLALTLPHLDRPPETTIKVLQDAIRERGPDPALMSTLGREYLRAGRPELAEGWFRRTLRVAGGHEEALRGLIEAYRRLDRTGEARESFRRYLAQYPDNQEVRREYVDLLLEAGAHGEIVEEIPRLLAREPRNRALKRLLALSYRKTGRFAEAVILYREQLREQPHSVESLRSLAYCLDASGQRGAAVALLEEGMKSMGERISILLPLGVLYYRDNELEKAAGAFRRAISSSPGSWQPYRNLGIVYMRSGNREFGQKFLHQAEQLRARPDRGRTEFS